MSSVHLLREFIGERLSAAASEIFSEFEKTILRYEEELDRQRRLLDVSWKPELKLLGVDLQQTHKTEQSLTDDQDRNSSQDLQEPEQRPLQNQEKEAEPPQIKEEEQEFCTSQEEEQLHLKQETDPSPVTEPDKEQLVSQSSAGPGDQVSGSPTKTDRTHGRHGYKADQPATSASFSCKICGETFLENSLLSLHIQVHKVWSQNSERLQYCCPTCGYSAPLYYLVVNHMRTHTGQKAFSCRICGSVFSTKQGSRIHMKVHTGEKRFSCRFCGKTFSYSSNWKRHLMVHTGEQPYSCFVCGKRFKRSANVNLHMKVHAHRGDVLSRDGGELENP
ncbi:zinc finger protein 836 [Nematolebias whitei]|uniref:zinc finger protein 836 n=1 Tax=Nematolebias whitei TaxID=451745 RepID=UPI0018995675|nr:zinc finger protein 836 [Nematolebias whitei]